MGEGVVFEVVDGELDRGVVAVKGVDDVDVAGEVGEKAVVAPGGDQLRLVPFTADTAHDEASSVLSLFTERRLGGL